MNDDVLAQRFEQARPRLHAIAVRMLGSNAEADDAVQETWLRLARADAAGIENLDAWCTTVVSRISLDIPPGTPLPARTLLEHRTLA